MPQTLRKTFSNKTHTHLKLSPAPQSKNSFKAPLSLQAVMTHLQQYINAARVDLLKPRQASVDLILREAMLR